MSYQISVEQLSAFAPHVVGNAVQITNSVNQTMVKFGIDKSERRVRYFMAQTAFETSNFTSWEEDLVYTTPERLVEVWPSRFALQENIPGKEYAPDFVNAPERLANLVYANRDGNGTEGSEDGWVYRGRGGLNLTFLNNYKAASIYLYNDDQVYLNNPDLVAAPKDAFLSAGWFWATNKLNELADNDSFSKATEVINGSTVTVSQRLQTLNKANAVFMW